VAQSARRSLTTEGANMKEVRAMLFSIQRLQILSLFSNPAAERNVTTSYAFAWAESVYPFLDHAASWHSAYEECFSVREAQIKDLTTVLGIRWRRKLPVTFCQLESHYEIDKIPEPWDRMKLVRACRYLFLHRAFDRDFWAGLRKECPSEAHSIVEEYRASDVYFL